MAETTGTPDAKLSWKETYKAMAAAEEDWSDLEVARADGLDPRSAELDPPAEAHRVPRSPKRRVPSRRSPTPDPSS